MVVADREIGVAVGQRLLFDCLKGGLASQVFLLHA
jgi:hypothetical protein